MKRTCILIFVYHYAVEIRGNGAGKFGRFKSARFVVEGRDKQSQSLFGNNVKRVFVFFVAYPTQFERLFFNHVEQA